MRPLQLSNAMHGLKRAADAAGRLLLAQHCMLCEAQVRGAAICDPCIASLPAMPACCPRCAMPSPHGTTCGECLARPPHFDATIALWPYAFPLDRLVHALKFHGRLQLARWLGAKLAPRIPPGTDLLVALPLHPARLAERGFNQAREIARTVARERAIAMAGPEIARLRATSEQARLVYKERARNMRGAFGCALRLEGRTIAVIDDVMTTGATLQEMAATLKHAGAARVVNCVIARTLPR